MNSDRCTVCDRPIPPGEQAVQRHENACEACGRPLRPHDFLEKAVDRPPEIRTGRA